MANFQLQVENTKMDAEKNNDAEEEKGDLEEKKDQEKLPEDILERQSIVSSFAIHLFLLFGSFFIMCISC